MTEDLLIKKVENSQFINKILKIFFLTSFSIMGLTIFFKLNDYTIYNLTIHILEPIFLALLSYKLTDLFSTIYIRYLNGQLNLKGMINEKEIVYNEQFFWNNFMYFALELFYVLILLILVFMF